MENSYLATRNTKLAATLAAFGVPFFKARPVERYQQQGKEFSIFNFEPGKGGEEICRAWEMQTATINENPEAPLSYVMATWHNYERIMDLIKTAPMRQIVEKAGRIYLVPINGTRP